MASGTDTVGELAVLIDLVHGGEEPVAVTGAIRPATAAGADGPTNLAQAVALAASPEAAGLGAVVVFGGQVHAARLVRKTDATGPVAFGSPRLGRSATWRRSGWPCSCARRASRRSRWSA